MTNQVDYFEIGTPNAEASRAFYGGLFGWSFGQPSPQAYAMINEGAGGHWDTGATDQANWAIFYVHVDDVAASLAKAQELGAKVAVPLVDNGNISFAHLIDPDGNRFAIWRPNADGM